MPEVNKLLSVTIDGQKYEVKEGLTVLQACLDFGIDVPYFCYHPCLSTAGNCRMCLVKIDKIPKLAISCATMVAEGMNIYTKDPEVIKARNAIMEFLLINHPLDCPVCDQAGECTLQDYSYRHGRDSGRFTEERNVRHKKDFGPNVKYWGSRCIMCTRCIRFCQEVSGTDELYAFNRGDRSVIDIFPGIELNNPLSMNVVDICPVGALVSSHFLYQARVWNMEQRHSLCIECSTGCHTRVDSLGNRIKRIVPSSNDRFMCDHGRLSYGYMYSEDRLRYPLVNGDKLASWSKVMSVFRDKIRRYASKSSRLAFLISAWNTNEAMFMVNRLKDSCLDKSDVYLYYKPDEEDKVFPKFRISGDRNPNINGFKAVFKTGDIKKHSVNLLVDRVKAKEVDVVIIIGGISSGYMPESITNVLSDLKDVIVIDYISSSFSKAASLVLPSLSYAEKAGSYVNDQLKVKAVKPVINPFTPGKSEDVILQELIIALSEKGEVLSTADIFDEMNRQGVFDSLVSEVGVKS